MVSQLRGFALACCTTAAIFTAAVLVASSAPAFAQAVRGTLLGNITDQGGLSVPGATITITETNTNISYHTTSNEAGVYSFPSLKDGTYNVVAELTGVKKVIRDKGVVDVNTTVREIGRAHV